MQLLNTRHLTQDGGDTMQRVRAAFADEGGAAGNPLDPITPMRLAFLTRDALLDH